MTITQDTVVGGGLGGCSRNLENQKNRDRDQDLPEQLGCRMNFPALSARNQSVAIQIPNLNNNTTRQPDFSLPENKKTQW